MNRCSAAGIVESFDVLLHSLIEMAHLWLWMACFFIMAMFWKYMVSWFTWNCKDFLQVRKDQCKQLSNVIPRLENCLKDMELSPNREVLNKNQCVHLFGKLILVMKRIDQMLSSASEDLEFKYVFEEMCVLQKRIEIVRKNCIEQEQWCQSALFQLQNKETFRELLLDLKCCYDTTMVMYLFHHPNQSNNISPIVFDAATYKQVVEDGQELKKKLELALQGKTAKDYEIAKHLLLRLRNLDQVDGGNLDALEVPYDFEIPIQLQKLGDNGDVYMSNWLGLTCATKVLKIERDNLANCQKEAGILASLSHPNLVQFFGCGINKEVGEISTINEIGEMYLVMELMDANLSTILKKAKRPLSYHVALDIMHQIAKGVHYLHDMQVAHLDLKPDNILCSSMPMEDLAPHYTFKVMDYGTSQLEVCSNREHRETSKFTIGTRGYMAPEMIKGSKTPRHPFQADVWSFAMICSEILSGKVPYCDLEPKAFYDRMKGTQGPSLRPDLPNNCEGLTTLIQECWSQDPLQRPTFSKICERLTSLKKSFWKRGSCALSDTMSIESRVLKVDGPSAPPKEILVDIGHQVSKAKGLLKMRYVGIVGMGGIGKTTLAKAIFEDAIINSLYEASCFVAECKSYPSSYEILCEVLSKLGNGPKPKNLGDAQKMVKEFFIGKKVLLILDDVDNEALVHDIVPLDIVQASKGTTVIITTRQWNTIKSFVGNEGRLNVEFLDKKAATKLFTSHLGWSVASLSPNFEVLAQRVVQACNGLPLSLKVMGAFLGNKERLRSWERALQRMARGRNLDGDEAIWNTLQISFDSLNEGVEKDIFLDVACFFCGDVYPFGISKAMILSMWSKDGILPVGELERLIDMSLLKVIGDGDILEMHDQLRDMGRNIARNTRFSKASMIPENGFSSKDVEAIEGIFLQGEMNHHTPFLKKDQRFNFQNLRLLILVSSFGESEAHVANLRILLEIAFQCSQLKALIVRNPLGVTRMSHPLSTEVASTLFTTISKLLHNNATLKILHLVGVEFLKHFPNEFSSRNSILRLNFNSCKNVAALPKEVGNLSSLTTLDLSGCSGLAALPKEVGNLSSLTTLDLSRCSSLAALPKEVGNLSSLTTLDLSGCSSLAALPKEVGNLSSLTTLKLSRCSSLAALPKEVGNLSSLTTLDLSRCSSLAALPKEVGNLSSLTTLKLSRCSSLAALPKEVGNLSSLTTLDLWNCSSLVALPKEVGNLSSLTTLKLSRCSSLVALLKEVGNLSSLTTLDLSGCSSLVVLLKEVGNLSSLTTLDLWNCSSLAALPKEVGNLSSLTTLDLRGCSSLAALPKEVGNLSSLTTLDLSRCSSLAALPKEVGNLSSLTTLKLSRCSSLAALPKEVGNLSSLTTLDLWNCSSLVALPKEVGNLSSLTTLDLSGCSSLVALLKEVGNLSSLTTLDLSGCSSLVVLLKEVGNLSSLTTLDLWNCSSLAALPKEVGNLSSLTTLDLRGCSSLAALPKEVGNLSSLTTLDLSRCSSLAALPKEVGNLSSLTTLKLSRCSSLAALPKEVGNLSSLTTLDLWNCSSLAALPKKVGNLSSLTTLDLRGCSSLAALPKEVGNLSSLTTLDLSGCSSLAALPKEVGNLSSLTTLDLSRCSSLAALPKEVGNLSSLTTLKLSRCSSLAALPKEVGNLSSLTTLDLWNCSSLVALPKEVGNLSSLTTLDLSGCSSLVALPKEVGNLSSLTTLDLEDCSSLTTLPKKVGNLSSLATLDLSGCSRLVGLPTEVGNLSSLTTLKLSRCLSLAALPKEVGNLSSLTTLKLSRCLSLAALPKEVGNLSSLTTLDLEDCSSLTTLPKEVGNLSSLTTLKLSFCLHLVGLPKEVGNLSSLTTLYLSFCSRLVGLPKEVWNLSSLTMLNLSGCSSLVALPKEVGNLSSLTTLDLWICSSLAALPKEVGNLSSLTTLKLSGCSSLVALPKEVGNLSSLATLDLSGCSRLVGLPKEVGNLSSLTTLKLSGCSSLITLPKEVGNLSSLTTLDLEDCSSLTTLPKKVGNLSSLATLDLSGCSRLVGLPKEVGNLSSLMTPPLDGCSNLDVLPKKVELSSFSTTFNSKEYSSKAQVQTIGDDKHVLKKQQHEDVVTPFEANFDLSKSLYDTIQKLGSLLLWVQNHVKMSSQQVLYLNKGKVESKNLITRRFLGQGCSGILYETTWLEKRTVKFARKDFPGVTSNNFVMEAIRLFELRDHPNIVKTFCWTVDNRSCSLLMEYMKHDICSFMRMKKEALRKKGDQSLIGANPSLFQLPEALDVLLQIAIGVEFIHDEGIYHGDLKPNNVFLDWKEGRILVKVADYGLLETKRNSTLLSQRALCFRMIEWSAPELFEDYFSSISEDLDFLWTTLLKTKFDPSTSGASCFESGQEVMLEKADSYNFGLISTYVLGGEKMWPAQFSPQELWKEISLYGLRPKLPPKCPQTLKSLIHACWNPNPSYRPTFSTIRNTMQDIIKEQLEV